MALSRRLSKLKTLELRENRLTTLPASIARLGELEHLDIGNNEFSELVCFCFSSLLLLYCCVLLRALRFVSFRFRVTFVELSRARVVRAGREARTRGGAGCPPESSGELAPAPLSH